MIETTLDIKPLSVNRAWQGRRFKTKEYDKWLEAGLLLLPKKEMMVGEVEVMLTFYLKNVKRSDVDNPVKTCLDLLVKRGYLQDDSQIYSLYVFKRKSDKEYIEIKIQSV